MSPSCTNLRLGEDESRALPLSLPGVGNAAAIFGVCPVQNYSQIGKDKNMNNSSVVKLVSEITEIEEAALNSDVSLESLGWDSLSVLSFMAKCESEFGIILDSEVLSRALSIGDLVQLTNDSQSL